MSQQVFEKRVSILCVEQESAEWIALQDYSWIADWHISLAQTQKNATDMLCAQKFDLILYDSSSWEAESFEFLRQLRTFDHINRYTPVIMCTSMRTRAFLRAAADAGIAEMLEKPVLFSQLLSVVKEHVLAKNTATELG